MPNPGDKMVNRRTGATAVFDGHNWVSADGKPQPMEASMRSRMDLGLGPMVQAQQDMEATEAAGNPYSLSKNPGNAVAAALTGIGLDAGPLQMHPFDGIAKKLGGADFQKYQQAQKAFESQLMPIMSGAAVSPSEAQRQIKGSLPELGDDPANLADKSRTRQMMLNGAAKAKGLPLPYPNVPTFGVNSMKPPQGGVAAPQAAGAVARVNSPEEAMRLPAGTVFMTPDGRRKVR